MENTMTLQDVLAVFERFREDVELKYEPSDDDEELSFCRDAGGIHVSGKIRYPPSTLTGKPLWSDRFWVELVVNRKAVHAQSYSADYTKGFFASHWTFSREVRQLVDFILKIDRPLRAEMRRCDKATEEKWKEEARGAADSLRRAIRLN